MPSTLGNLHHTSRLAVEIDEIFEGTISVAYLTTWKMPHRTLDYQDVYLQDVFQRILVSNA